MTEPLEPRHSPSLRPQPKRDLPSRPSDEIALSSHSSYKQIERGIEGAAVSWLDFAHRVKAASMGGAAKRDILREKLRESVEAAKELSEASIKDTQNKIRALLEVSLLEVYTRTQDQIQLTYESALENIFRKIEETNGSDRPPEMKKLLLQRYYADIEALNKEVSRLTQ
ncbi:hypothetical protein [Haloferula helveola]